MTTTVRFEDWKAAKRKHWTEMLKDCERRLEKALFPEPMTAEFYDSRYFKENGLDCTRLGEDYWMYLEIALNSYKYNLEYATEQLQKIDTMTEQDFVSEQKSIFKEMHDSWWQSAQWNVKDKYHAFKN